MNIDIFDKFMKYELLQLNVICLEHLKLIVILKPKLTTRQDSKPVRKIRIIWQTPNPLHHTTICKMDVIGLE